LKRFSVQDKNQIPKAGLMVTFGYEINDGIGHYEPHHVGKNGTPEPFKWCHDYPPIRTPYSFWIDLSKTDVNVTSNGRGVDIYIRDDRSKIHLTLSQSQLRSLRDILNAWEPPK
jgi:hypothetical protein